MARSMNTYSQPLNTGMTSPGYSDWGTRLSAPLRAAVPKSNDTGQVNWANTLTLPAANQVRDYEVYALSDSLQATKPIYVRLDYGMVTTFGWIQMAVGTSTNGAGALSGIQYGAIPTTSLNLGTTSLPVMPIHTQVNAGTSNARFSYASTDGSYIAFFFNIQQAGPGAVGGTSDSVGGFVVERTRDSDGTPNGNGYMVWRWNAVSDTGAGAGTTTFAGITLRAYDTANPNSYQPATTFDYGAAVPPPTATSTLTGTGAQVFPVYGATQIPQGASKALALAYTADVPRMGQVTLTHYGAPTQWISFGGAQPANVGYMSAAGSTAASSFRNLSPLFRWE